MHLLSHQDEATSIGFAGRAHVETVCRPEPIVEWYAQALAGDIPSRKQRLNDAAVSGKKRTALLFHRVGPYHFARARAAGKMVNTKLIEVFKSDDVYGWDPVPGADGFERVTLFENNLQAKPQLIHGVQAALDECKPDVVAIPGWADAVAFSAIQWCGTNRVPVIVMSETTAWDESRIVWKERIKRYILKMCAAGFVGGRPHAEYLVRLGMSRENIFQGYDAVDNEYFNRKTNEARKRAPEIRKKYGLPENYLLASARFVDKKNLLNLIRAYALYRQLVEKNEKQPGKAEIWHLVLLGDGPLKSDLNDLINSLGLQEFVLLPGFKQYDELPAFYALARAFIHCSTVEQWGLVVNEAMASGLPVLVSSRCGCAQNLVQEGVNGFTFDPYNVEQMADVMARISGPQFPISDFGAASTRIIADWSPDRFAKGLSQAVEAALSAPPHPLGPFDRLLLQLLSRK